MTPEEIAEALCNDAKEWWGRPRSPHRIAEAIRVEREACAKVAEDQQCDCCGDKIAAAIRART